MKSLRFASLAIALAIICGWSRAASAVETAEFRYLAPRVGDVSSQELDFLIELTLTVNHGGGEVFRSAKSVERLQTRWTKVLAMNEDVVTSVAVRFDEANETQIADNKAARPKDEPVSGGVYLVTRAGEALTITDDQGNKPTAAEVAFLERAMDSIGRPNSLGRFLHGKKLIKGQPLDVPVEVARDMFGFRDAVGEIASLRIDLRETHATPTGRYAVLDAEMKAQSPEEPRMAMDLKGQMQLDMDTCRVVGFVWEGPVSLSERRGKGTSAMSLVGLGTLAVEMRAKRANAWPARPTVQASSSSSPRR